MYLLERDNQNQYRVAYPEAIKYGRGLMFHTPTDRFVHIQIPLLCFPVYAYLLFCLLQTYLAQDNIFKFLETVLKGIHNVSGRVVDKIRKYEGYLHAMTHYTPWLYCLAGVDFNSEGASQSGFFDLLVTANYRHYIELKSEDHRAGPEQVVEQITANHYPLTYPHTDLDNKKPAFFYGVKWTNNSTSATVVVDADEEVKQTKL